MRNLLKLFVIFTFCVLPTFAQRTFYIAANGLDTNNGTSKATPWLHAPGMINCSNTCGSTTPTAQDNYILRGGDTWHMGNSSLTPYTGLSGGKNWAFSWAGSNSTCNLDIRAGAVNKTGCIYIGVDKTWFSGASWVRPIMTDDNPLSTSVLGSCTFDNTSTHLLFFVAGSGYTILDNIEFTGWCWNTAGSAGAVVTVSNPQMEVTNCYFHGWSLTSNVTIDEFRAVATAAPGGYAHIDYNVVDGTDSTYGTTDGAASGFAFGYGFDIDHNVFVHTSNGYIGDNTGRSFHDNLMFYSIEPTCCAATHGNVYEPQGEPIGDVFYYNNLMYVIGQGQGFDIWNTASNHVWAFNNIYYLYRPVFPGGGVINNGTDGSNCWLEEDTGIAGARTFNFFNNTFAGPCVINQKNITATTHFQNNHFINYSPAALSSVTSPTIVDDGNNLFQTLAVANGQGYIGCTGLPLSGCNNYAPTAISNATYHAGASMAATCSAMTDSVAAAACTFGYSGVTYNTTNHTAIANTPIARGSSWDVGAYQLSSAPAPPALCAKCLAISYPATGKVQIVVKNKLDCATATGCVIVLTCQLCSPTYTGTVQ